MPFRGRGREPPPRHPRLPLVANTFAHAEAAGELSQHHGDPFDRMLLAQARVEALTLVTHDRALGAYDVPILWT